MLNPLTIHKMGKIRRQLRMGKITLEEAEEQAKPFMDKMNKVAAENAQKKGEQFTPLTFAQFLTVWNAAEEQKHPGKKQW